MHSYVHGYSQKEAHRLNDQANAVADFIHDDSTWPDNSFILEAGCGVGAQTKIIAPKNPSSRFISVDISKESLLKAQQEIDSLDIDNVTFQQGNLFDLPYEDAQFDHILLCFVLEHLQQPVQALTELKRVLKPGGTITVIEGDHGSTYFHPESQAAQSAIQCQVILQQQKGGDANIGRKLYPILEAAQLDNIQVSPRQIYVDDSMPHLVEGFTKNTFTAMIKGISTEAIGKNLISKERMDQGIRDLLATASGGGTFCYTFFKAIARKPEE